MIIYYHGNACKKGAKRTHSSNIRVYVGLTFKSPGSGLPQEQALVFEGLSQTHHVLLAEGMAVL